MRAVLLTLLAACEYTPGVGGPASDASSPDGPCATFSSLLDTCVLPDGDPLTLSGALRFDTNTGDLFAGATPIEVATQTFATPSGEIKAILGSTIILAADARLRAEGSRGFAILAMASIELETGALIDVAVNGAGARAACPSVPGKGTNRDGGAGGGGGGGFGGPGGVGGAGDSDGSTPAPGGLGGTAIAQPLGIVGGCPGAVGGNDNNDTGGRGGTGGGAVYLAAKHGIDLASSSGIDAAGDGGGGGGQHSPFNGDAGGGGGGSGGMIVLESATVASSGTLAANGGGGGEGSGDTDPGASGMRGAFGTTRASGGTGRSGSGSDGGSGGAKPDRAGGSVGAPLKGGGGGGGGGAGVIRILTTTPELNALVSPEPS